MKNRKRQAVLREAFCIANAISQLDGYDPDDFEKRQKERIVLGEISIDEFIQTMRLHARQLAAG